MTPADSDHDGSDKGTSLTPQSGFQSVDAFVAGASATTEPKQPKTFAGKLLDYSAHAAMIVGLIGFAWTVGDHVVSRPTAAQIEAPPQKAAAVKKADELADLRTANQQMAADIRALHQSLDKLRVAAKDDRAPAQIKIIQAGLEGVKADLNAAKAEANAATAQLSGKVDRLSHEPNARLQQLAERVGKLEHGAVDTAPTGSLPPEAKAVPVPPIKPASAKVAALPETHASEDGKPQIVAGWVVRDVYDGVALIEGRHGSLEVVPGVSIPGAGVVKSIDRHGGGWTVTTTKGQLAYAAMPRTEHRPAPRDFYLGYGEEF